LRDDDLEFHRTLYDRLRARLEEASRQTHLPEASTAGPALNDLLVRVRMH
jgi:hypothetical protein